MEVYWVMKVYNIWNTEYVGADAGIEWGIFDAGVCVCVCVCVLSSW